MRKLTLLLLFSFVITPALRAQQQAHDHGAGAHKHAKLGTVNFENSGAREAQAPFLRGLALLHSFEYEDAADAFREAEKADPAFALPYWFEAVTHAKLLWGIDYADSARAALARLAPSAAARLAKARTPRERAYGAAVEGLYADADLPTRARAYADSLRALSRRYPGDLDATAFTSIALQMALASDAYTKQEQGAIRDETVTLAERVFKARPDHPGAAHYLIHATDHPRLAARGLGAARAYSTIAPDAEHALHMPSHIFLQLGLWDDVATSNERAWKASREWVAQRGKSVNDLDFHAFLWLHYAYLQQGRYRAALTLIDTARALVAGADLSQPAAADARFALPALEFRHAVETGDWSVWTTEPGVNALPENSTERARYFAMLTDYFKVMAAGLRKDSLGLRSLSTRQENGSAMMKAQFAALSARARGAGDSALKSLQEAAKLEENLTYSGPPNVVPSHELLGAALLEANRPREAAQAYQTALDLMPRRNAALLGLARAQAAAGNREAAANAYAQLLANLHAADADNPLLAEARRGAN